MDTLTISCLSIFMDAFKVFIEIPSIEVVSHKCLSVSNHWQLDCYYNNNVIEEGRHAVLLARQQYGWADNEPEGLTTIAEGPTVQRVGPNYTHVITMIITSNYFGSIHLAVTEKKTAPSSWPSIMKLCSRDTVVCIVDANNIDGHPIRKIVCQKLRGPVTWQADNAHYSGEQAGWQWCCTYIPTE